MKHLKRKLMMTLALLITAVGGAWADETPLLTIWSEDYVLFTSESKTFDDKVTVTFSDEVNNNGNNNGWYTTSAAGPSLLTVAGINGYTITSCKFYTAYGDAANGYTVEGESPSVYLYGGNVYTDANQSVYIGFPGIKKIEVYGSSATPVPLTWDATAQTATLTNGMPAGNVTVSVEYFPQAEFAKSTDATLAPTAIDGVPANTDGAIVEAGTVANIGTSEVKQGTLMYFVIQPTDNTIPDAPDYDTRGWSENVPTADGLQEGNAYVWYYIKGAEPANIADRTDDNTRSDSDIKPLGTTGFVTLEPEPTYNVEFAEGIPEPDKWSADPNTGVTKGETVTVTYTGTKKIIGVKAEKKATTTTLDNTITAWTAGSYAVPTGGLTYSAAITVSGEVTLVLTDGETLTLNKGISLAEGATLTVEGNGTMNVNGTNDNSSSTVAGSGMMCFKSGTLVATGGNGHVGNDLGQFGQNGGISHGGSAINGSLTLEGGNVTATGGNGGNAGGANSINWATGGNGGSAITGNVIINGGSWTANDGSNGTLLPGGNSNVAGTGGKAVAGTVTDNRN